MIRISAILAIALLAACSSPAPEGRCALCGMDTVNSRGRFLVDLQDGTRLGACSAGCAARLVRKHKSPVYRVQVYGTDALKMIDGKTAFYVFEADILPQGAMPPSVFAFSSEEAAGKFAAEHKGRIGTLEEVWAIGAP